MVAIFTYGIVYNAWGLFLNLFVLASDFDKEFLGLANMAPAVSALVLGIPLGIFSNKIGQKKAMLVGLAASAAACGLIAVSSQAPLILIASFLWGMGTTLFTISQAPLTMEVSDAGNRLTLFSLNSSLQFISGIIGNFAAGLVPGLVAGWFNISDISPAAYQSVFLCSAIVGFAAIIPIYLIHKEKHIFEPSLAQPVRPTADSPEDYGIKWLFKKDVIRLLLPNLITGAGAGILIPYLNVFYMERFELGNEELGFLFSLSSIITGMAVLAGPRLTRWFGGKIKLVVVSQSLSLAFMMLAGFSSNLTASAIGFLMRAMLMNIAPPGWTAFVMEQTPPARQGTISSYLNLLWTAGWLSGPYISGLVQESYGFKPLFIATFCLYALAIGLTWKFFHKTELNTAPVKETVEGTVSIGHLNVAVEKGE